MSEGGLGAEEEGEEEDESGMLLAIGSEGDEGVLEEEAWACMMV